LHIYTEMSNVRCNRSWAKRRLPQKTVTQSERILIQKRRKKITVALRARKKVKTRINRTESNRNANSRRQNQLQHSKEANSRRQNQLQHSKEANSRRQNQLQHSKEANSRRNNQQQHSKEANSRRKNQEQHSKEANSRRKPLKLKTSMELQNNTINNTSDNEILPHKFKDHPKYEKHKQNLKNCEINFQEDEFTTEVCNCISTYILANKIYQYVTVTANA